MQMEGDKQAGSNESTCLYIVGRYNKLSRNLSQTPWFIDGVKRMESSVQEMIIGQIEKYIKFEKAKFSACGREDVDVRMLGGGRPFVVELFKPETMDVQDDLLEEIEKSINNSHDQVKVRDLQLGEKKEVRRQLRDGETDKTKGYRALCCIDRPIGDKDFEKLNQIKDLSINQKTPVRVLHRYDVDLKLHLTAVLMSDGKLIGTGNVSEYNDLMKGMVNNDGDGNIYTTVEK